MSKIQAGSSATLACEYGAPISQDLETYIHLAHFITFYLITGTTILHIRPSFILKTVHKEL
jgi:hypothetical protein